MQHKSRKDKNGKTFADKVLEQYISYISEEVYEQYGLGKKDSDIIGTNAQKRAWMVLHNWDDAKEKFVIGRTKTYIRTLDSTDSNSTNLQFIKALVNRIAAYLSVFCQNGPNRTIKSAREMLVNALYTNNSYVRGLELYRLERSLNPKPRTQKTVADKKKRERIQAQQKKRDMERQVHIMFVEVQTYRKK